ncbi:MAG: hypothetical protein KDA69_18370, partial [Planctomycetaceae bacterium]|nr:hypothetical protein [Planctomycetaceae bacterium]
APCGEKANKIVWRTGTSMEVSRNGFRVLPRGHTLKLKKLTLIAGDRKEQLALVLDEVVLS